MYIVEKELLKLLLDGGNGNGLGVFWGNLWLIICDKF